MSNNVNPKHYADHQVSPLDLIDSYGFTEGFCAGNVIKYTARASEKNGREDYLKAAWYLLHLIGLPVKRCMEITNAISEEVAHSESPSFIREQK